MKPRRPKQLTLPEPRTHGGRRRGAGRKRKPGSGVPHRKRPFHDADHPLHVTIRIDARIPNLRRRALHGAIVDVIAESSSDTFRIVGFSVQHNHVHYLIEADGREELSSGMRTLNKNTALAVNRVLRRRGPVLADRYHCRALRHPREVRHVLVYILLNWRKHQDARGIDPCSSGPWFDGWLSHIEVARTRSPVAAPRTWLLRLGWRKWGLLDPFQDRPLEARR
jgi:REP element-mobilizing transposase RayT